MVPKPVGTIHRGLEGDRDLALLRHRVGAGLEVLAAPFLQLAPGGVRGGAGNESTELRHVGAQQRLEDAPAEAEAGVAEIQAGGVVGGGGLLRDVGAETRGLGAIAMATEDSLHHFARGLAIGDVNQTAVREFRGPAQARLEPPQQGRDQEVRGRVSFGVAVLGHERRPLGVDPVADEGLENRGRIAHLRGLDEDLLTLRRLDDQQ